MEVDFAEIIREVSEMGASDLHMTVGAPPMVRIRGELRALDFPILSSNVHASRLNVIALYRSLSSTLSNCHPLRCAHVT